MKETRHHRCNRHLIHFKLVGEFSRPIKCATALVKMTQNSSSKQYRSGKTFHLIFAPLFPKTL